MRLADPLSVPEGNVPVAIFSLGKQHMFLPISERYQDMLRRIAKHFDLEEDVVITLRTSAIGPCRGRDVEIPESAYVYLWKYLDEVDISIEERAQERASGFGLADSPATVTQEIPAEPSNEKPLAITFVRTNTLLGASQPELPEDSDPSPQFEITITGPKK